jgi:hypothetical protein
LTVSSIYGTVFLVFLFSMRTQRQIKVSLSFSLFLCPKVSFNCCVTFYLILYFPPFYLSNFICFFVFSLKKVFFGKFYLSSFSLSLLRRRHIFFDFSLKKIIKIHIKVCIVVNVIRLTKSQITIYIYCVCIW